MDETKVMEEADSTFANFKRICHLQENQLKSRRKKKKREPT
jgi:hypothetical protein